MSPHTHPRRFDVVLLGATGFTGRHCAAPRRLLGQAESPARPVLLPGHSLGGQLVSGHELTRPPTNGVITVGGAGARAAVADRIVTWWHDAARR